MNSFYLYVFWGYDRGLVNRKGQLIITRKGDVFT